MLREVRALLGKEAVEKAQEEGWEFESPFEFREEVEVVVSAMSSTGEHLFEAVFSIQCYASPAVGHNIYFNDSLFQR